MPRRFIRKYLPSHESVRQNRHFARFGGFLHHPNLWHLNRHSVAGGIGIGLFAGLVPGPLQMLTAALLAVPLHVNLPIALATTLYTNPLTIGPLYVLAYQIGALIVDGPGHAMAPPDFDWAALGASARLYMDWVLSLGKPLFIGLLVLAVTLGVVGYFAVQVGWRAYVLRKWRQRARLRRARQRPGAFLGLSVTVVLLRPYLQEAHMEITATIANHLEGFREGLVADGYDLKVDEFTGGTARLRITAGPDACAECLVPKKLMVSMLEESLRELPQVQKVEVAYPDE